MVNLFDLRAYVTCPHIPFFCTAVALGGAFGDIQQALEPGFRVAIKR